MKKRFIQICSLFGLLVGLMFSAHAQGVRQYEATIPFDFNVGSKAFTAGDYAFGLTNQLSYQKSLTIRDLKSGKTQVVLVTQNQANELAGFSQLLFNRYEDRYFLAEIATPTLGAKFLKAKIESRLAKAKSSKRETIALKN